MRTGTLNRDLPGQFSTWTKGTRVQVKGCKHLPTVIIKRTEGQGLNLTDVMGNVPRAYITMNVSRSKRQQDLSKRLEKHGLARKNCGIAAIQVLLSLNSSPMSHAERLKNNRKECGTNTIGVLILAGLAAYNAQACHYHATEQGAQWLRDLEAIGALQYIQEAQPGEVQP
jgi:hypothetical protein